MNFHEYQAKELFAEYGIPVPAGRVAATPLAAVEAARALGGDMWVVKAQVHAGGRGKGTFKEESAGEKGGVRVTKDPEEAVQHVAGIGLGRHGLRGRAVAAVIVVALMQTFLILLPRLGHGGQLERREQGVGANIVGHDLIGGDGDIDAITRIGVR